MHIRISHFNSHKIIHKFLLNLIGILFNTVNHTLHQVILWLFFVMRPNKGCFCYVTIFFSYAINQTLSYFYKNWLWFIPAQSTKRLLMLNTQCLQNLDPYLLDIGRFMLWKNWIWAMVTIKIEKGWDCELPQTIIDIHSQSKPVYN